MKISSIMSIDFLIQNDVLTNNVQNMVTSHKYTNLDYKAPIYGNRFKKIAGTNPNTKNLNDKRKMICSCEVL